MSDLEITRKVAQFKSANTLLTGHGALSALPEHLALLGVSRPAIITDKGVSSSGILRFVTTLLAEPAVLIIDDIPPEPEVSIIDVKRRQLAEHNVDGIIAVGGGSAIDSAKVLAATYGFNGELQSLFGEGLVPPRTLPLVAIPTTAGTGSEVTNIAILSDEKAQLKKGIVSPYLLPDVAIVAPEMTVTCPSHITAASGVDAFVHGLEAFISVNASPITDALAIKAMRLIYHALPLAYSDGNNIEAREDMATGSLMAGLAFGNAGVGAVHALAYPLGGRYHLSHGMSNAVMLPHVMRVNAPSCEAKLLEVAAALGINKTDRNATINALLDAIEQLCRTVDIPASLRAFDIPEEDITQLAKDASNVTRLLRNNPRVLSVDDIEAIYRAAY
ncbi:iron-containing alcohol dehydrogenase family protein [Alteromonas sp. A079]|uniref:iron-containing alcohol dehydrogenase family protein n=1 Tax=Alteromonas sp. A079 TaxID=3410268 RepID=UPI003BA342AA